MTLSQQQINELLTIAIEAAKKAGSYIAEQSTKPIDIEHKPDSFSEAYQVVTEVDRQAQQLILEVLKPTFDQYDLGLLTEESEDNRSRFEKDYFWCIDPLDGTLPFTESIPGYSVSIALVSKIGKSQLGVIFDPVRQILYRAIKGQGAFKNDKPFTNTSSIPGNKFTLLVDRSMLKHPQFANLKESCAKQGQKMNLKEVQVLQQGGAALNACWVLENSPAVYLKFPKSTPGGGSMWDFAASSVIVHEAGGNVSDIFGKELNLNRKDSTFMNHSGVLYCGQKEVRGFFIQFYREIIL